MLVLHMVFSTLFRFKVQNYPVYALSGILFWNFFQQSIVSSMNSLRGNAHILKKLPVPLEVFPIATVFSGIINLLLALLPLLAILFVTGHPIDSSILFLPVAIVIAALFTLGAGFLLSPLAVFFSDVVELVGVVLTLLFYMTPIFYPMAIVENHPLFFVVRFNPTRSILEVFRDPIYLHKIPPVSHLSIALLLAVVMLALGAYAFRRMSHRIPFYF
jgi:ABC-type polysaccharide/polyol phosphate export permease